MIKRTNADLSFGEPLWRQQSAACFGRPAVNGISPSAVAIAALREAEIALGLMGCFLLIEALATTDAWT